MRNFLIYLSVTASLLFGFSTAAFSQVTNGNITYYHSSTEQTTSELSESESTLEKKGTMEKNNHQLLEETLPKTNEKNNLFITVTGFVLISLVLGTSIITYRRKNK